MFLSVRHSASYLGPGFRGCRGRPLAQPTLPQRSTLPSLMGGGDDVRLEELSSLQLLNTGHHRAEGQ